MSDNEFFRVIVEMPACTECGCGASYTIVYKQDGEEVGIGRTWGGHADDEAAKEAAEEHCGDLNNAAELAR